MTAKKKQQQSARSSARQLGRHLPLFIKLSQVLIGTPAVDPRVARRHLQTLSAAVGPEVVSSLLRAFQSEPKVQRLLAGNTSEARAGRNLLTLWFTGLITQQDGTRLFAHSEDYFDALMWNAAGAHPPASSDGYFGHWSLPPDSGR